MVALDEGQVEITQNGSNARNLLENSGFPPVPRPLAPTVAPSEHDMKSQSNNHDSCQQYSLFIFLGIQLFFILC
jgi:hypothetical protein